MSRGYHNEKVDYFRLPRPLWRKLKKHVPKRRRATRATRRQAEGV